MYVKNLPVRKTPVLSMPFGLSASAVKSRASKSPGLLMLLFTMLLPVLAAAQIVASALTGTVTDQTGGTVAGAKLTATNTSTGAASSVTSNSSGEFIFPQLAPGGPYTVQVEASGFKTAVRTGIHLDVSQHATLPITMEVGATSETVQVYADAAQVDTTTATVGEVIENRAIDNLPLNQRNVYSLVFLAPGVTGSVNSNYNSLNISIDGGRPGASDVLLDGIPALPPLIVPIGAMAAFPSVDAVQEFRVMNNQYSAEFGRSQSGIINIILKSGTNAWHGSAYDFVRNSSMDANTFFNRRNHVVLQPFSRNQFGGSLNGPVWIPKLYNGRDKTFFLFSYEGLRQGQTSPSYFSVPTAVERTGDFSHTVNGAGAPVTIYDPATTTTIGGVSTRSAFNNNLIPSNRIDGVAAKIVNYFPLPNTTGQNGSDINDYFSSSVTHLSIDTFDARVDEVLNERNRFFVRYSRRNLQQPPTLYWPQPYQIAEGGYTQPQVSNSAAIDYTRTWSEKLLTDIRYGFSRTAINFVPISAGFNPSTQLGFPGYIAANADHLLFPGINTSNYSTLGDAGQGWTRHGGFEVHLVGIDNTKIIGHHAIRFGGDARLLRANDVESGSSTGNFTFTQTLTQQNPNVSSSTQGNALASLLLGVGTGSMVINSKNAATQSKYFGLFVQDDWQALPKLSINLGLRYNLDVPRTERFNRMEVIDPNVVSPLVTILGVLRGGVEYAGINGANRRQFSPRYLDFDPRFGFSYAVNDKTTVRGGYGIFFGPSLRAAGVTVGSQGFSNSTAWNGAPANIPVSYLSNPFPNGLNLPVGTSQGLVTGIGTGFNTPLIGDNKVGYIQSWELDIQRQLPSRILLDAAYVGTHGIHLNKGGEGDFNLNQLTPAAIAKGAALTQTSPNPFFGKIATGPESGTTIANYYLAAPFPQFTLLGLLYPIGGRERYDAFQFKMEKRTTRGLSVLVSFTDQKQIDDYSGVENVGNITGGIQNIYNDAGERAVSSNNIGRILVVSAVYELPFGRGRGFGAHWSRPVDTIFGGWQINGIATEQNGFPLSPTTGNSLVSGNAGNNVLRPNVVPGVNPAMPGSPVSKLTHYVNAAAFTPPPAFTFGNAPRALSNVRGPGMHNIDASIFKNFHFADHYNLELRGEFFNVLNQVVFGSPNMNLTSGAFGSISSQQNVPRDIQAAAKLVF